MTKTADCPECGRLMRWDRVVRAWDCGPEPRHGFWDRESVVETEKDPDA